MDNNGTPQQGMDPLQYRNFVIGQLRSGTEQSVITQRLMQMGMEGSQAMRLVDSVAAEMGPVIKQEMANPGSVMMAVIGGVAAAILGGIIWGVIVSLSNYEIGYMAVGIGALCGFGVVLCSKGARGPSYQGIAVACSLFGILIGKYATFFIISKKVLAEQGAADIAAALSPFSSTAIHVFTKALPEMVNGFDILWVVLAIATAVKIPAHSETVS